MSKTNLLMSWQWQMLHSIPQSAEPSFYFNMLFSVLLNLTTIKCTCFKDSIDILKSLLFLNDTKDNDQFFGELRIKVLTCYNVAHFLSIFHDEVNFKLFKPTFNRPSRELLDILDEEDPPEKEDVIKADPKDVDQKSTSKVGPKDEDILLDLTIDQQNETLSAFLLNVFQTNQLDNDKLCSCINSSFSNAYLEAQVEKAACLNFEMMFECFKANHFVNPFFIHPTRVNNNVQKNQPQDNKKKHNRAILVDKFFRIVVLFFKLCYP